MEDYLDFDDADEEILGIRQKMLDGRDGPMLAAYWQAQKRKSLGQASEEDMGLITKTQMTLYGRCL